MGLLADALRTNLEQSFGILGRVIGDKVLGPGNFVSRGGTEAIRPAGIAQRRAAVVASMGRDRYRQVLYQFEDGHLWRDVAIGFDTGRSVQIQLASSASRYPNRRVRAIDRQTRALIDLRQ